MELHSLTNTNANLQEKMRYFSDYFVFANEYLGRLPDLPYDNPHTLVNKIIFQLENNIEKCPVYIDSYFVQLKLFFEDYMRKKVPGYDKVEAAYADFSVIDDWKCQVKWLKKDTSLLTSLQQITIGLEDALFANVYSWLIQYIQCPHELSVHQKDIHFCTQLLVSFFRSNGHSSEQVARYIRRILSKSRYDFPLPPEIIEHEKNETYPSIAAQFLKNRDFVKQFEGFKNLFSNQRTRAGYFVFVIPQVLIAEELQTTFKTTIDRVSFISPDHPLLATLKKQVAERATPYNKLYEKFFGPNKLLAYLKMNYEQKEYVLEWGFRIINDELAYLNYHLDQPRSLADKSFLFVDDFASESWNGQEHFMAPLVHVNAYTAEWINDNPFEYLRDVHFGGKEQFLHNERTFLAAEAKDDISLYWQYIENLFWFQEDSSKDIHIKFVNLIMKDMERIHGPFLLQIGTLFTQAYINNVSEGLTIDKATTDLIRTELGDKHNLAFDIEKYLSSIQHPFLKEIFQKYIHLKSATATAEWIQYLSWLALELKEFRNADLHSGRVNQFSRYKLKDLVPALMNKARWITTEACKNGEGLNYKEIIEKLTN